MARVKAKAMRDMSPEDIHARLTELREEMFNLRFRNAMKQLDNPLRIRENRREVARLQTVLREKVGAGQPAGATRESS